jgi:hypothetical protein
MTTSLRKDGLDGWETKDDSEPEGPSDKDHTSRTTTMQSLQRKLGLHPLQSLQRKLVLHPLHCYYSPSLCVILKSMYSMNVVFPLYLM